MTLEARDAADGVLLPVHVSPRASRTAVEGVVDGILRVRLMAPPVADAANQALRVLLSKLLDLPRGAVELKSGERSRRKLVLIRGLSREAVIERLTRSPVL